MVFRFLILSDEVDDFKREIKIDAEATFLDLHDAILESVGYTKDQMCSFFICDDDWSKNTEITLVEMDTTSEVDNYIMAETRLEELLEDEHQKLMFVFDYMTERAFFMELREIEPGKDLDKAICQQINRCLHLPRRSTSMSSKPKTEAQRSAKTFMVTQNMTSTNWTKAVSKV